MVRALGGGGSQGRARPQPQLMLIQRSSAQRRPHLVPKLGHRGGSIGVVKVRRHLRVQSRAASGRGERLDVEQAAPARAARRCQRRQCQHAPACAARWPPRPPASRRRCSAPCTSRRLQARGAVERGRERLGKGKATRERYVKQRVKLEGWESHDAGSRRQPGGQRAGAPQPAGLPTPCPAAPSLCAMTRGT